MPLEREGDDPIIVGTEAGACNGFAREHDAGDGDPLLVGVSTKPLIEKGRERVLL